MHYTSEITGVEFSGFVLRVYFDLTFTKKNQTKAQTFSHFKWYVPLLACLLLGLAEPLGRRGKSLVLS